MCGISGAIHMVLNKINNLEQHLNVMNKIQKHRGPDGQGIWVHKNQFVGLAHCRLSIIDLSDYGKQPMTIESGNWVCFNGEIYNYLELRKEIGIEKFKTNSDTEVILRAYEKWGEDCVNHFIGMFAFALWDEKKGVLFCARDRFGIKPFYYIVVDNILYFSSEMKALLPFLDEIETNQEALQEYLTFQFCLENKTLFKGIKELEPAHTLIIANGELYCRQYWQVYYNLDWHHTEKYFIDKIEELLLSSIKYHIRSDVPIGGYVSGGFDSSAISSIASSMVGSNDFQGFVGKFAEGRQYDESQYAKDVACENNFELFQREITSEDFLNNIQNVIYHLDTPVAGPGSFCQYMVSELASKHRKVVLGGQGGDEIFGGYTRYLIAYFEQCIKGAIDGTMNSGNFIVTYESIIPNLTSLKNYKGMLQYFWSDGLFDSGEKRYYRLINRAPHIENCIRDGYSMDYNTYGAFEKIFNASNVNSNSYFDRMSHFDFKTLLPALLHVEDRMSMAHGLESRVPLLDHRLIELVAMIPSHFKLKNGDMKYIFKQTIKKHLPDSIIQRTDKMGFPIPLNSWMKNDLRNYVHDILSSNKALNRDFINNRKALDKLDSESQFSRNLWGILSLELWQQTFHDNSQTFKKMVER